MRWIRLDENLDETAKILAVSDRASWAYVRGLLYCSRALTDGFIPGPKVPALATRTVVEELVKAGLWEQSDGGYQVHDWLDYQEPAAEARQRSDQARRAAQARWRKEQG